MALSEDDIIGILQQELSQSTYVSQNMQELMHAMEYYLGKPNGREIEGRSSVTSTDIADSVEWIMPEIMKSFTQNNEVVIFDPVHEGDEQQAELETEFVYDILMKRNNGFILIHEFVKDALLQRNGILKVYYEDESKTTVEKYTGLTRDQLNLLASSNDVEILKVKESYIVLDSMMPPLEQFDVTASFLETKKSIKVVSIPVENFRVNANHNSIDVSNARFAAHVEQRTISDLNKAGFDKGKIEKLTNDSLFLSGYRFSLQDENYVVSSDSVDESQKLVSVSECYIQIDVEETGVAELYKITVGGVTNPTVILSMEKVDESPFITATAILMPHKFQGLSLYDRLKEIQDQKTALLRNIFDNIYLTNNQRTGVIEGQVNLDDLLVSRPGGIVRMKRADSLVPIVTPQLGDAALNMVNYLDTVRAGRSGVSPEGQVQVDNIGDRVGSEGIERLMNSKEELVGLIIRVIAETGIKPLCTKIRNLANKHLDVIEDYKWRGQWVKVNPVEWKHRTNCTVRVGTGTGNKASMLQALTGLIGIQKEAIMQPGQALVNPQRIFNTLDLLCKLSGLNGANNFFIDPKSPEGMQAQQMADQKSVQQQQQALQVQNLQLQIEQGLVKAEEIKAQAASARVTLQAQLEAAKHALEVQKQQDNMIIAKLKQELEDTKLLAESDAKHNDLQNKYSELQFKYDQLAMQSAVDLTKIEADAKQNEMALYQQNINAMDRDQDEQ